MFTVTPKIYTYTHRRLKSKHFQTRFTKKKLFLHEKFTQWKENRLIDFRNEFFCSIPGRKRKVLWNPASFILNIFTDCYTLRRASWITISHCQFQSNQSLISSDEYLMCTEVGLSTVATHFAPGLEVSLQLQFHRIIVDVHNDVSRAINKQFLSKDWVTTSLQNFL